MTARKQPSKKPTAKVIEQPAPSETVRTSIVLPRALDENLGVYGMLKGRSKSEIITNLLIEFLEQEGYQPLKRPQVEVKYK